MTGKLTFQELQTTCQALGTFAAARSQPTPDKDVILTVKKINGRETLQTARLSKMPWYSRIVLWLGFGGSSLKSVSHFLEKHEPHLPTDFQILKNRSYLSNFYTDEAINNLSGIEKDKWEALKKQKVQGCKIFKRCVSHHNQKIFAKKVFVFLPESDRIEDLCRSGSIGFGGVRASNPNPMGLFPKGDEQALRAQYQPQTSKLKLLFKKKTVNLPPHVLGFCYEYGLGLKKDVDKAITNYQQGAAQGEYSACYNLASLLLEKNQTKEAIDHLKIAETILTKKIDYAQKVYENMRAKTQPELDLEFNMDLFGGKFEGSEEPLREETAEEKTKRLEEADRFEREAAPYIQEWKEDLQKLYPVFIEAHKRAGNQALEAEYRKKAAPTS